MVGLVRTAGGVGPAELNEVILPAANRADLGRAGRLVEYPMSAAGAREVVLAGIVLVGLRHAHGCILPGVPMLRHGITRDMAGPPVSHLNGRDSDTPAGNKGRTRSAREQGFGCDALHPSGLIGSCGGITTALMSGLYSIHR